MQWVTTLYYLATNDKHPEIGTLVVKSKSGRTSLGPDRGKLTDKDFQVLVLHQLAQHLPTLRSSLRRRCCILPTILALTILGIVIRR